jgi:hypothetical protein
MNNKSFVAVIIAAALVLGGTYFYRPIVNVNVPAPAQQPPLGANSGTEHYFNENFYGGISMPTLAKSSSSPAALGSAPSFFITATTTTQYASSSLISANSQIYYEFSSTTPIAGTTCSLGAPATSTISTIPSSASNATSTGFVLKMSAAAPGATTPYCVQGFIISNK